MFNYLERKQLNIVFLGCKGRQMRLKALEEMFGREKLSEKQEARSLQVSIYQRQRNNI
jgi:hypothetical protein